MKTDLLPKDVAAYLTKAATDLAAEQGFLPSSEESLRAWMEANCRVIGERAQDAMYHSIPKNAAREFQPRFVRYAASRGLSPEAVLEADGHKMTNFLCWKG